MGPDLTEDQKREVENLLEEFQDIFSDVPGRTNLVQHRIQLTSNVPVRKKLYPVPYAMRKELDKETDNMIKLGVIEPSTFSRAMRKLLDGSQNLDNYLDDVLCHTLGWTEHLVTLRDFFLSVRRAGLTLRPSKCRIGERAVDFLGHNIGDGMIQPRSGKIEKIAEAVRPETKKQVRSYLGLVGYYQKFIPNFASIATPLTDLTRKNQPNKVNWGELQESAFQQLKMHLMKY